MRKDLLGYKAAFLVSGGFIQEDLIQSQKALSETGCSVHIISPDPGVVNGWDGQNWGHHYAVDAPLNQALGVDYDFVVVPGGQRSVDKLKLTAHTKRFLGSFLETDRPAVLMDDALRLIIYSGQVEGYRVSGPALLEAEITQAAGEWQGEGVCFDRQLMTGPVNSETRLNFVDMMVDHFKLSMKVEWAA